MKVYLNEIKEQDKEVDVTDAEPWVMRTLEEVDEDSDDVVRPTHTRTKREAKIHFNMRKVDEVIVVSGDMDTKINLLCSRCALPFQLPIKSHFTALYCKDKEMAGISYLDKNSNPRGQNKGYARHAQSDSEDNGAIEAGNDLEITYVSEDFLDLSEVLLEQLQLRIPFQPLHSEDCKGICANCGADWNIGRCACSKILAKNPFSGLKNFKN